MFRGVPFAAPCVGDLRWKPPQPLQPWNGVHKAISLGRAPHPLRPFGDMNFRSESISENCYLNIWTASSSDERLRCSCTFTVAATSAETAQSHVTTARPTVAG